MNRAPVVATLLLLSSSHVGAQETEATPAPMVVTTDTIAYCLTLAGQISAKGEHGGLPREVRDLQAQGRDLCAEGHVRGGINRLRRALMVLQDQLPPGSPGAQEVGDPPTPAETAPHD